MNSLELAKKALSFASGDQVEVTVQKHDNALTRFANSYIHQNVKDIDVSISFRVIKDNRQGVASTNIPDMDVLEATAKKAMQICEFSPKNPHELKMPEKAEYRALNPLDEQTKNCTPEQRADAVATMVNYANPLGLTLAGAYSIHTHELAIANSNGVEAYNNGANASLKVTAMSDDSSGAADIVTPRISEINAMDVVKEAASRALMSKNPSDILEPGDYEVVFLHYAVAEMIGIMNWGGFSGKAASEGRSFAGLNLDKKICSDKLTIADDPFDPRRSPMLSQFDMEGYPKQKLTLIEKGVPVALCYDGYTARKEGKQNTGHYTGTWGPHPLHLSVMGGESTVDEMISHVKKGVLVSRFWYSNLISPLTVEFTGMTRDGLFLIENGKIVTGLKNMRVTDSIIRIFDGIEEIENVTRNHDGIIAPAMRCKAIRFSSKTKF